MHIRFTLTILLGEISHTRKNFFISNTQKIFLEALSQNYLILLQNYGIIKEK